VQESEWPDSIGNTYQDDSFINEVPASVSIVWVFCMWKKSEEWTWMEEWMRNGHPERRDKPKIVDTH